MPHIPDHDRMETITGIRNMAAKKLYLLRDLIEISKDYND